MNPDLVKTESQSVVVQQAADPDYWTIEGMRAKEFSVGIFVFLVICVAVFSGTVLMYARGGKQTNLKTGEKILLGWIVFGIVVGVVIAVLQLLQGRLF